MGDEGPSDAPASEAPASRKRATEAGDFKRVAEIVMVLSALGQMRGGRDPTAAERALVAEARERLVGMCEAVKPKELFSREAVRVVVEDLGLNRSKDPVLGFRPPKMSISEKLQLTKKKMEESKETRLQSSIYSPQQFTGSFGGKSEHHGNLAHDASRFMQDKSPMITSSGGGFQNISAISHTPVLTSAGSSFKPSHISDVQSGVISTKSSASPSVHIGLNARPAENVPQKIPTMSSTQSTSVPIARFGHPNKLLDHRTVKSEITPTVSSIQPSQQMRNVEAVKPSTTQAGQGSLHISQQHPQGLSFAHTPAILPNHNDIAKSVQKILQSNVSDHPSWTPPSSDYMSSTLHCQICKNPITDIEGLLVCDACEKGNHLKCLQSYGNKSIPKVEWHCPRCLASSNGRPLPPKYGRVTRAPVSSLKAAPNASTQSASKRTEDFDSKANQQKGRVANGNSSASELIFPSNDGSNHQESVPESMMTGAEMILTTAGGKSDDEACKAVGGNHLVEKVGAVYVSSGMHSLNPNDIENDSLTSNDTKPTSEVPKSLVAENSNSSEAPFTQDSDQTKSNVKLEHSVNHLHDNAKPAMSETEVLDEKKLLECTNSCSVESANEIGTQASADELKQPIQLDTT